MCVSPRQRAGTETEMTTCYACTNEAQGSYYNNHDNLVEACDDCAATQPIYEEPSEAVETEETGMDDDCRTCGGSGGGAHPMQCMACDGSGSRSKPWSRYYWLHSEAR